MFTRQHASSSQDLWAMANRSDRFIRFGKVTHDGQHAIVESQVLWRSPARQNQRVVLSRVEARKIGIDAKTMARFLAIRLMTFEIMDGGQDRVARFFVRTNSIALMPNHEQHLEWNHDLVVFDEVSDDEQNSLGWHGGVLVASETRLLELDDAPIVASFSFFIQTILPSLQNGADCVAFEQKRTDIRDGQVERLRLEAVKSD
jgi:hypothetical protein